ncbi:T6SS effector BTH_I2691 family protein, partial [Pseudomonas asiatica]
FLYNGVHLIELEVKMKLGEYYALQSAHLRELQHKANASIAEARDRMHRNIDDFEFGSMKAMRKVRPIIQHGLMSLAMLDPRFTNTMISVTVWVEGKAEEVHGRLFKEASMRVTQASSAAQLALVDISVAAGTLETNARKLFQGMQITSQQAARLVRTGFSGLRGVAGSWELLLAIGGLYLQQDSLGRNQDKAETEIGPKAFEARLALQGSQLGLLGGQVELVGLILRSSASPLNLPRAKGVAATGEALIRLGALVSAVAGVFDAAQAINATRRTASAGDETARNQHLLSSLLYGSGAVAFSLAVLQPLVVGPLGLAIAFTLAAYQLSKLAQENESTDLERWVRRCCFGKADEIPIIHWNVPEHADIAFAELNAATLGTKAKLNFESLLATDPGLPKIGGLISAEIIRKLRFLITLPMYDERSSGYRWKLIVHRHGDGNHPDYVGGETIASGNFFANTEEPLSPSSSFSSFTSPRIPDHDRNYSISEKRKPYPTGLCQLEISGSISLMATIGKHTILAATLLVMYWPDRSLPSGYIEICVREVNE